MEIAASGVPQFTFPAQPTLPPAIAELAQNQLMWFPELGYGYYPVRGASYDRAYFERYAALAETPLGKALNECRANLVLRWAEPGEVLDVGVGCGSFVDYLDLYDPGEVAGYGYDVNPVAVDYLKAIDSYRDLYAPGERFDCVTFWDVLEHIPDPRRALRPCNNWVFASLPIFRGDQHALRSKHFRRDEHFHYWTRKGFIRFADSQGFDCLEVNNRETILGREDIETFVLRRRS